MHQVKRRIHEATREHEAASKELEREEKRGADKEEQPVGESHTSMVTLRRGVRITLEEAEETDDDTLVMLAAGVAYATSDGSEGKVVRRQYQQVCAQSTKATAV